MLSEPKLGKKERPRKGTTKKSFSNCTSAFTFSSSFFLSFFFFFFVRLDFGMWHESLYSNEKRRFVDASARNTSPFDSKTSDLCHFENKRLITSTKHYIKTTLPIVKIAKTHFHCVYFVINTNSCLERSFIN